MTSDLKIYSDDPLVHYKDSPVNPERTKHEIDDLFTKWGIKKVAWNWDPQSNIVYVMFTIVELINGVSVRVPVRVDCPTIWDRARPRARPFLPGPLFCSMEIQFTSDLFSSLEP
jgi:hypothetical protein